MMSNNAQKETLVELEQLLKSDFHLSISDFAKKVNISVCGKPIVRATCGFIYAFECNSDRRRRMNIEDAAHELDIGIIKVIATPETKIRSDTYVVRSTGREVALYDSFGNRHGTPGGWSLTYAPATPIGDVIDCNSTSSANRVTICCRIFFDVPLVQYEGTHCVWFWVPTLPADDSAAANLKARRNTSAPTPVEFENKRLSIKNEIRILGSQELEEVNSCTKLDLRPSLEHRSLCRGKNIFHVDMGSGVEYWINYNGYQEITYGASDMHGNPLPIQITRGFDAQGIAICHLCGPGTSGPLEGLGDCKVIICDPIFRIPLPPPSS